jgi:hypothetical protein
MPDFHTHHNRNHCNNHKQYTRADSYASLPGPPLSGRRRLGYNMNALLLLLLLLLVVYAIHTGEINLGVRFGVPKSTPDYIARLPP